MTNSISELYVRNTGFWSVGWSRGGGFLIAATAGVLVLCSATLAAISLAPDIYLGRICRTSQDAEIRELERRRRELMLKHDLDEFMADAALREAITAIRSRPVRRLSAATFANVTAAVVTALAPFVALYLQFGPHL